MNKRNIFFSVTGLSTVLLFVGILWLKAPHKKSTFVQFVWDNTKQTYIEKNLLNHLELKEQSENDFNGSIVTLQDGIITIYQNDAILQIATFAEANSKILWRTPDDWWVDHYYIADSNNDGKQELNISVWKAGDFGNDKPFWVTFNNQLVKNHFFVFQFDKGKIKPFWQSSNLDKPNCEFIFGDADNDKKMELITIEGEYGNGRSCEGKYIAVWKWNGWGFSNIWRSREGKYNNISIRTIDKVPTIIVNRI